MSTKNISRTVWILSLVSMFNDISSDMLYPIMPVYLKSIGFSIVIIGVLEGFAEAAAGISKGYFGKISDSRGRRLPFVQWGYFISGVSKPLLAFFTSTVMVFFSRTLDKLGKGVRTGARDALLSDEATPQTKGTVFGFHRGFDTLGATIGPILALVFLHFYPGNYKSLFIIAFFPVMVSVCMLFLVKEKKRTVTTEKTPVNFFHSFLYLKTASKNYKQLLYGLLFFALFNSSDIFLLLMIKQHGFTDIQMITIYVFYNFIYAAFSFPLGKLSDKIGFKKTMIFGMVLFSAVYGCMAITSDLKIIYFLFFLYGIYMAATDGISKAWISNLCKKEHTAAALGTYSGFNSLVSLLASSLAGILWYSINPSAPFLITSVAAIGVIIYFAVSKIPEVNVEY